MPCPYRSLMLPSSLPDLCRSSISGRHEAMRQHRQLCGSLPTSPLLFTLRARRTTVTYMIFPSNDEFLDSKAVNVLRGGPVITGLRASGRHLIVIGLNVFYWCHVEGSPIYTPCPPERQSRRECLLGRRCFRIQEFPIGDKLSEHGPLQVWLLTSLSCSDQYGRRRARNRVALSAKGACLYSIVPPDESATSFEFKTQVHLETDPQLLKLEPKCHVQD